MNSAQTVSRRIWMQRMAGGAFAGAMHAAHRDKRHLIAEGIDEEGATIQIDPTPRYELSPHLYMQFMEPLGTNDSSVEASWDHLADRWRPELIDATRSLAPGMVRWGGIFSSYYRWREGVGPRDQRVPMHNVLWGGIESNQIGTAEFVDFCRQVHADPLMCVNFECDGRPHFRTVKGKSRIGDAAEAAAWVAYCNQADHAERRAHGMEAPLTIPYWQIGNETSYSKVGFDKETAAVKTSAFAAAMKRADPQIQVIGWGDSGWGSRMAEVAGEHLSYLAFHHMFDPDDAKEPVLRGENYRRDPAATWEILMKAWKINDAKIRGARESLANHPLKLAMTECHFAIPGNNRNDVMRSWATGVSYARILNNHQRHGDLLKIATAADFCGTRWNVNAIILGTHPTRTFLMPVAIVMRQYRKYLGEKAVSILQAPEEIDVVASRSGTKVFVNLVNTLRDRRVGLRLKVTGHTVSKTTASQLAEDPTVEISSLNCLEVMQTKEFPIDLNEMIELPPASVTSLELLLEQSAG